MAGDDDSPATARPALVRSMRLESDGVVSLRLEPIGAGVADWQPGAHIDVAVGGGTTRQYSLSGRPGEADYRIAVLHEPDGRGGSAHIHRQVRVGDALELTGPRNHFGLEGAGAYTLVAGGIGITPLLPMIARLDAEGRDWSLYYAGRSRATMAFLDELAPYGDRVHIVARDEGGRLDLEELAGAAPEDSLFYVCGPERMLDGMRSALASRNREQSLRTELFAAPEADGDLPPGDGFTIELRASGLTLEVPPERSILEVVTGAGVDVMTDCEEGICGSCETRVLDGIPDHRDYVLTTQEKAQNDCMMICVSRAACSRLVLDL